MRYPLVVFSMFPIWLVGTGIAIGQDNQDFVTKKEFYEALAGLRQQIGDIQATLDSMAPDGKPRLPEADSTSNGMTKIDMLQEKLKEHDQLLFDQRVILGQIAKRAASGNGLHTLDIAGNMQRSQDFRREMSGAVHQVLRQRKTGSLLIRNQMSTGQTILVNRTQSHYVMPNSQITVEVPVGTVTAELPGYEAAKNWTVGPPNYLQEIVIQPKPQRVVRLYYDVPSSNWQYDPFTGVWSRVVF